MHDQGCSYDDKQLTLLSVLWEWETREEEEGGAVGGGREGW